VPLHVIVGLGEFLLVCRDDFRPHHAWLIAEALAANRAALPLPLSPAGPEAASPDSRIPLHIGAHAYFTGGPLPALDADHDHDHGHDHVAPR
jgi:hypothetical protein